MEESGELEHVLSEQQTHELVCPDCEACITYEVIVKKRKRDSNEPSLSQEYSAGEIEENDPDSVLPHMLFEQESHDLICPVCEHAVTGEVILQKRKREIEPVQSNGRPHGIQANLKEKSRRQREEDGAEEDELDMRRAIQEQDNFEILCPDCESCITHEVIVQKRKRVAGGKPSTEGFVGQNDLLVRRTPLHSHRPQTWGAEEIEEQGNSDEEDPPLKRHRRAQQAGGVDPQEKQIIRVLQDQRIFDLTCPDCASRITYQVLLKKKTSESGKPVGLLDNRGQRRVISYVDQNPWKTRYEITHGHSKPYGPSKAKAEERKDPQPRVADHGTIAISSLRGGPQPGEAEYGALASSTLREDPQSRVVIYEANGTSSLTEPLLPVQGEATGEAVIVPITWKGRYMALRSKTEDCMGAAITYFLVLLFLYCIYWILRAIPPA